jgi:hypothetical protein
LSTAGNVVFGGAVGEVADTRQPVPHDHSAGSHRGGDESRRRSTGLNLPITGAYGDLVLQANGSYTYTLNAIGPGTAGGRGAGWTGSRTR